MDSGNIPATFRQRFEPRRRASGGLGPSSSAFISKFRPPLVKKPPQPPQPPPDSAGLSRRVLCARLILRMPYHAQRIVRSLSSPADVTTSGNVGREWAMDGGLRVRRRRAGATDLSRAYGLISKTAARGRGLIDTALSAAIDNALSRPLCRPGTCAFSRRGLGRAPRRK